jgi:hypothetical protein
MAVKVLIDFLQGPAHGQHVRPAPLLGKLERAVDQTCDTRIDAGRHGPKTWRATRARLCQLLLGRRSVVHRVARKEAKHGGAARPDVNPLVDGATVGLLGSHVGRSARHHLASLGAIGRGRQPAQSGNSEVEDLDLPRARQEQVRGFDIAVDDPLRMRGSERAKNLVGCEQDLVARKATAEAHATRFERLAVEELGHQKPRAVFRLVVLDDLDDALVADAVREVALP